MILPHGVAQAIVRGAKTELRRPRTSDEPPFTRERQVIQYTRPRTHEDAPAKHADDTTVTETVCHVLITYQQIETLGEATETNARAEGFRPSKGLTALHRFRDAWAEEHGDFDPAQEVWVVRFELDRDARPRFLARVGGYTESRHMAIDELEAVPPGQVEELNARSAREPSREVQEARARRAARERAARLRDLERKATVRGVDIKAELTALDRYLAEMRRKVDRS